MATSGSAYGLVVGSGLRLRAVDISGGVRRLSIAT